MSERKSAEIKFRCTPSFKAAVQSAADAVGVSMSEYIESAVRLVPVADIGSVENGAAVNLGDVVAISPDGVFAGSAEEFTNYIAQIPVEDEPPVDDDGNAVACTCRPWEFCTHKVGE